MSREYVTKVGPKAGVDLRKSTLIDSTDHASRITALEKVVTAHSLDLENMRKLLDLNSSFGSNDPGKAKPAATKATPARKPLDAIEVARRGAEPLSDAAGTVRRVAAMNNAQPPAAPTAEEIARHGGGVTGYLKALRAKNAQQ